MDPLLVDIAKEVGITYRQADHWCACRYIRADFYSKKQDGTIRPASKGSGKHRRLPEEEVHVLRVMARLVRAGIDPAKASELVRRGQGPYQLAPGVLLHLEEVA